MNESISLPGRISRAITVTVLSFFLMLYALHFISWFPNFWGGAVLIVRKYVNGTLTHHFLLVWLKAVTFSATHWKGAFEISTSGEIAVAFAWWIDRALLKYHSRFLRDVPKK